MGFDPISYILGKQAGGGGGGGGVTVEPLSVTENGVYNAPSGKAYSPVNINVRQGIPINISNHINPQTGEWERPAGWPDLDSVTIANSENVVYFTYDLTKTPGYGFIALYAKTGGNVVCSIERGHLSNGEFIADASYALASGSYFRQNLDQTDGNVQLWRLISAGTITMWGFVPSATTRAESLMNTIQPCVELRAHTPGLTDGSSPASGNDNPSFSKPWCYGTAWLEAARYAFPATNGWLGSCLSKCYSLQKVDTEDWDVSNVVDAKSLFEQCISLQKIDVSGWDTGKITSMQSMFKECLSLQELDCSGWDTESCTTMYRMFYYCMSLRSVGWENWDTSSVTSMGQMCLHCSSLESVDIHKWDLSKVTDNQLFDSCDSLRELDIHGVDLSSMSTIQIIPLGYSLVTLNASGVDTNGKVPSYLNAVAVANYYPFIISVSYSLANWNMLTRESLLRVIDALPQVSTTTTLTLGNTNRNKLTADEIAVATAKGWTVA